MRISKIISLGLVLCLCFGACQSTSSSKASEKDSIATNTTSTADQGNEPFDVSFLGVDKNTINTKDLVGKVVFINFWATWCPPCIEEMPSIQKLYDKFKDNKDIVFLLVDIDADLRKSEIFMKRQKLDMPLYIPNSNLPASFVENAIPTTVILDKRGNIDVRFEGGRDYSAPQMTQAIESLLAE